MSDDSDKIRRAARKKRKPSTKAKPAAPKSGKLEDSLGQDALEALKAAAMRKEAAAKKATSDLQAVHTVVSGDTLKGIAQKYYGSQAKWKAIYEANKDAIGDNPDLIRVGQLLKIPKLS